MTYHLMESWGFLVFDIFGESYLLRYFLPFLITTPL